jgi:hypothetical protein
MVWSLSAVKDFNIDFFTQAQNLLFSWRTDSDCSELPDLDQINFEDLESGSEDSGEGAEH